MAEITSPFQDAGIFDTHTATIDWADGSPPETAALEQDAGSGEVSGSHLYLDDQIYGAVVCVTDNAGDTGCAEVEVVVNNLAPTLVAFFERDSILVNPDDVYVVYGVAGMNHTAVDQH